MNLAHVFICTGPTCAANVDREGHSKPPIDTDELKALWKEHKLYGAIHLTFAGCLGRCNLANQALIVSAEAPRYFMKLEACQAIDDLVAWAKSAKEQATLPPLPQTLSDALYERMETC